MKEHLLISMRQHFRECVRTGRHWKGSPISGWYSVEFNKKEREEYLSQFTEEEQKFITAGLNLTGETSTSRLQRALKDATKADLKRAIEILEKRGAK